MQADGQIADGVELSESDLPPVLLNDFLENVSLLSAVDVEDDEDGSNKVALMTVHSSKGLEFPYVFVAGMEENIFPSGGFLASDTEIEEERRLFYVAMTRAKKILQLAFAQTRTRNGKHESNSPSRFVREIDVRYVANPLTRDDDDTPAESGGSGGFWKKSSGGSFKPGYQYGQSSRAEVVRRAPAGNGPDYGRRDQTLRTSAGTQASAGSEEGFRCGIRGNADPSASCRTEDRAQPFRIRPDYGNLRSGNRSEGKNSL